MKHGRTFLLDRRFFERAFDPGFRSFHLGRLLRNEMVSATGVEKQKPWFFWTRCLSVLVVENDLSDELAGRIIHEQRTNVFIEILCKSRRN